MTEFIITCDSELKPDGSYDVKRFRELVRCKDCKYWKRRECGTYGTCESENMNMAGFFDSDWYCADGERREADG